MVTASGILRSCVCALVAALTFAVGCGGAPTAPTSPGAATFPPKITAPPGPIPTIQVTNFMAFGDSLTEGEWWPGFSQLQTYDPTKSYPTWLLLSLQARYTTQTFVMNNEGSGGSQAVCDAEPVCGDPPGKVPERFVPALIAHQPQVVLLLQGVNDLWLNQDDATIVSAVADALRTDIKNARVRGVSVFVSTLTATRHATAGYVPPPGDTYSDKSWFADDPSLVLATNAAIRQVAAEEGASLVDGYDITAANRNLYVGADGVHLSIEGYQALAAGFLAAIKAKYENPAPPPPVWSSGPSIASVGPYVEIGPKRPW